MTEDCCWWMDDDGDGRMKDKCYAEDFQCVGRLWFISFYHFAEAQSTISICRVEYECGLSATGGLPPFFFPGYVGSTAKLCSLTSHKSLIWDARGATHQTKEDKIAAKALANRKAHTQKDWRAQTFITASRSNGSFIRGQGRKNFLEKIKANRVQLLPLSIPTLPEVTGSDGQYEDVESGMKYLSNWQANDRKGKGTGRRPSSGRWTLWSR